MLVLWVYNVWNANRKVGFLIKMRGQPTSYDQRFSRYGFWTILPKSCPNMPILGLIDHTPNYVIYYFRIHTCPINEIWSQTESPKNCIQNRRRVMSDIIIICIDLREKRCKIEIWPEKGGFWSTGRFFCHECLCYGKWHRKMRVTQIFWSRPPPTQRLKKKNIFWNLKVDMVFKI